MGGASSGGSSSGGTVSTSPCHSLSIASPVLTPKKGNGPLDDGMQLTATSDDGLRITAAWLRKTGPVLHLRHATLRPWDDWPSSGELGPVADAGIVTESGFAMGRGPGGSWAATVRTASGPRFFRSIDAGDGGTLAPGADLGGIEPTFVARDAAASSHLVGTFDVGTPGQLLRGFAVDGGGAATELAPFGCAHGQPPRAAAVPFADRWLVVASRSGTHLTCPDEPGPTASAVDVLEVSKQGPYETLLEFSDFSPVLDVGLAPHPSGGYAVLNTTIQGTQVWAARVDAATSGTPWPQPIESFSQSNSVVVSAVGDQLVLARKSGPGAILVSVYEPSLVVAAETLVATAASNPMVTAVQGSPSGEGLVLGWTEQAGSDFTVHLARIDCSP